MLEPWRSRYLHAIGVEIYLPRHALPGAAPSSILEWDASVDDPLLPISASPANTLVQSSAVENCRTTKNHIAPLISVDASTPRKASMDDEPSRSASSATTPVAKIHLLIAIASPGILVVDELPAQQKTHTDTLRLLNNLLFAVGCREAALQSEPFEWPLPNLRNRQIDRDEKAGRETLTGFLNKKIHDAAIHTVFLLGDAAQFWVSQPQRDSLQGNQLLSWKSSVSAQAVLRDASLKRQWWQDLRRAETKH